MNESTANKQSHSAQTSETYQDTIWHLRDIKHQSTEQSSTIDNAPKVCVAIIDTGCDVHHPCLQKSVIEEIDFVAFDHGGHYGPLAKQTDGLNLRSGLYDKLGIDIESVTSPEGKYIHTLVSKYEERKVKECRLDIENPAHRFGYHGTACSGLIAADKPTYSEDTPPYLRVEDIGFRGVVPGCNLLCVSTPFDNDVRPIIRALLYCVASNVDTILLPRGISQRSGAGTVGFESNIKREARTETADSVVVENQKSKNLDSANTALDWLIKKVSEKIPLIVASGNRGYDEPEYPAVAQSDLLIVVGAHNEDGNLSSYTSGKERGLMLTAPSDDEETNHANSLRRLSFSEMDALSASSIVAESPSKGSSTRIHSLDTVTQYRPYLTDQAIYGDIVAADQQASDVFSSGSNKGYDYFGGTSAASAIVAGAVALLQSNWLANHSRPLSVEKIIELLRVDGSSKQYPPRLNLEKSLQLLERI